MKARVLAVAGDPGGGNALAPVMRALLKRDDRELYAYAYRQTEAVWTRHELPFTTLQEPVPDARLQCLLDNIRPSIVLTGTSMNGIDAERRLTRLAKDRGIPSIAVLDFWSNYRGRFEDTNGEIEALPDVIAVMDDEAANAMLEEGINIKNIRVTGQPVFEDLRAWVATKGEQAARLFRNRHRIRENDTLVVFLSQPLSEIYGDDPADTRYLGYTQHTSLSLLVDELRLHFSRTSAGTLIIRPHPREERKPELVPESSPELRVLLSSDRDPLEAAVGANVLVGMSSILLLEAGCLGKPVLSLQPNLRGENTLPLDRLGLGEIVTDPGQAGDALSRALGAAEQCTQITGSREAHSLFAGATENIVSVIDCLLAQSP